ALAPPPAKPRTFALLIGISEYADKKIHPRPHAEKDATALYNLFTSKDHLGADPKHVRLLLGTPSNGKATKATRANCLQALQWLAREARPDDLVLFAFIGQGGPLGRWGERRCYLLADSTVKGRDTDAVAAEEIEDE